MPEKRLIDHPKGCIVDGCKRPYLARGMCQLHYKRWKSRGKVGGANVERIRNRLCSIEGCGRKHCALGLCAMHRGRVRVHGHPGPAHLMIGKWPGSLDAKGYRRMRRPDHPNAFKTGDILEHMMVMSDFLGRPLRKGETVHHKNGVRRDNRIDNLELWSGAQPAGQRVIDKVAFAIEILMIYATDKCVWPKNTEALRTYVTRYKRSLPNERVQPKRNASGKQKGLAFEAN